MFRRRSPAWLVCLALVCGGCGGTEEPGDVQGGPVEVIELPAPDPAGEVSVAAALARRRSVRDFTEATLSREEIGGLFWAAQGITGEEGARTNPSAGGLYPLEIYAVTSDGVLHYLPDGHRAELLRRDDLRGRLAGAALDQEAVRDAPAVFVVCAVFARTEAKYGERTERYVHLEAGHVGQSLLLQAVALGLGGVPIGAFRDEEVQEVLGVPANHEPLYLIPIGHPAG
jgi:SagB-type dehydrogenase family enzyme